MSRRATATATQRGRPYDIMIFMQLNQPAPDFELPDLQGNPHKLSDYRGKIVIVNFWSAECPHSERTDRYLVSLLEQMEWGGGDAVHRGESKRIHSNGGRGC